MTEWVSGVELPVPRWSSRMTRWVVEISAIQPDSVAGRRRRAPWSALEIEQVGALFSWGSEVCGGVDDFAGEYGDAVPGVSVLLGGVVPVAEF